jgi:para-aminobenzoate synthetase component 1
VIIQVPDTNEFRLKALRWASAFDVFCYLDANNFDDLYSKFDTLIAVGAKVSVTANAGDAFEQLEQFRSENPGWMTGFFGYDLKNETEKLSSENPDYLGFPGLYFFVPQHLIIIRGS